MAFIEKETRVGVPVEEVFAWHDRPGAFQRLAPPWARIRARGREIGLEMGARLEFDARWGLIPYRWESEITSLDSGRSFVDAQRKGPFARWEHTHLFEPDGPGATVIRDRVDYELPLGALGRALAGGMARREIERVLDYKSMRLLRDLTYWASWRGRPRLRVLVSGSTGLIGRNLVAFMRAGGYHVEQLVRATPSFQTPQIYWNPRRGEIESSTLEGFDAVVHLCGENIAARRWTPEFKTSLTESRVDTTRFLCERLAELRHPPKVLISASATGYYGHSAEDMVDEGSPAGQGFLGRLCRAWEAATTPAAEAGIRVVNARIGVVLSADGGALAKMLPAYRWGLGGRVGDGRQWMSWISLEDLTGVFPFLMGSDIDGPVNVVSPRFVRNADFARTLGRVLGRPALAAMPAVAVRALFGEMGETLLLEGARVKPLRLEKAGFVFQAPDLEGALRETLGRRNL